jgi:hypothetical protein
MSTSATPPNPEQEECKKERDNAFDILNKDQAEYDRQLLALSAAFLGVSLAFVKDVVPLKDTLHLWEFDAALGSLLACICLVLGTFQYSIHGHFRLMEYWQLKEKLLQSTDDEERTGISGKLSGLWTWLNHKADRIKWLNRFSGVLFALGTIFLVIFVMTNMYDAAHSVQVSTEPPSRQTVSPDSCKSTAVQHP